MQRAAANAGFAQTTRFKGDTVSAGWQGTGVSPANVPVRVDSRDQSRVAQGVQPALDGVVLIRAGRS